VLKRVSLPVLHSAAALLRLAEMEYCGTTSFFIRVLLDKKYALPFKVGWVRWGGAGVAPWRGGAGERFAQLCAAHLNGAQ
jgi:hypothetical protein